MASERAFRVRVTCDMDTGQVLAAYIRIRKGEVAETKEIIPCSAIADYDAAGELLGVELISPCEIADLDFLFEREPAPIKRFFHESAPLGMVATACV